MDLNGKLVCLIETLTIVITEIAAINVAGAISHGTSSIRYKIVFIMSISLERIEILDFESKKEKSSRGFNCISRMPFDEQSRNSVTSHNNLLLVCFWPSDSVTRNIRFSLSLSTTALELLL